MQKLSICQTCGTIVTRSMPRCPICGGMTDVRVIYEFIPNPELEAEDLEVEDDPMGGREALLDMLFDAWKKIENLEKDVEHYKEEEEKTKGVIKRKIEKINALEFENGNLASKLEECRSQNKSVITPDTKKKGLFGK